MSSHLAADAREPEPGFPTWHHLKLIEFLEQQDRLMQMTEPVRLIAEAVVAGDSDHGRTVSNGTAARNLTTAPGRAFGDYELLEPIALHHGHRCLWPGCRPL